MLGVTWVNSFAFFLEIFVSMLMYSSDCYAYSKATVLNFESLWMQDFMAQQPLVPNLVQVFIFTSGKK